MSLVLPPLPPASGAWSTQGGQPTQEFAQFLTKLTQSIQSIANAQSANATSSSGSSSGSGVSGSDVNTQTASYILRLSDNKKIVEMNVGSANTVTVPPNSSVQFPIGAKVVVIQGGSGQTQFVAGAGVTLQAANGDLYLAGQYAAATLYKVGLNTWIVSGDLVPAVVSGNNVASTTTGALVGTNGTAGIMLGLALAFTPSSTGRVLVLANADTKIATALDGCTMLSRYGTGAAPAHGSAQTGNLITSIGNIAPAANSTIPFPMMAIITGLTLGTPYWFDLAVASQVASNQCTPQSTSLILIEL